MTPKERKEILVAEIRALSAQIDQDGLLIQGSQRQQVLHPAVGARHQAMEALRKLEKDHPSDDSVADELAEFLS